MSFISAAPPIKWQFITGKFYRRGMWWGVHINIAEKFRGAKITVKLDNYRVIVNDIDKRQFCIYLPVCKAFPEFYIHLAGNSQQFRWHKQLQLQKLSPRDRLIGVYGEFSSNKYLSLVDNSTNLHILKTLPDLWPGLQVCNWLIWKSQHCSPAHVKMLRQWLIAGGKILAIDPWIVKRLGKISSGNRREIATLKVAAQSLNIVSTPVGEGVVVYGIDSLGSFSLLPFSCLLRLWPQLKVLDTQRLLPTFPETSDLFDKKFWSWSVLNLIWLCCAMHLLLLMAAKLYLRNQARYSSILIALTVVSSYAIYYFITSYVPIYYQKITIDRASANTDQNMRNVDYVTRSNYHYFYALQNAKLRHHFSSLPMPISATLPMISHEISLIRSNNGWITEQNLEKFSNYIWQTQEVSRLPGKIRVLKQRQQWTIANQTPYSFECYQLHKFQGYRLQPLLREQMLFVPIDNFSPASRQLPKVCRWLMQQWSTPAFVGMVVSLPVATSNFASHEQQHWLWISLLEDG